MSIKCLNFIRPDVFHLKTKYNCFSSNTSIFYLYIDIFWDNFFLFRHCMLKYILAQHFSSFDIGFLYRLTVRA
jgi:hypothetical protein